MKEVNLYISDEWNLISLGMKAKDIGADSFFCLDYPEKIDLFNVVTEHIFYNDKELDNYVKDNLCELPYILSNKNDKDYFEEIGDKKVKVNCLEEEFVINFIIF